MEKTFTIRTAEDMEALGRSIGEKCTPGTVISLRGSLGAGKTVFAKGVARSLGINEAIVSPTFTLVQEYEGRLPMYHMDLYRITSEDDFQMIGGEDMLYSDGVTLVEWSEIINDTLPVGTLFVQITVNDDQSRTVVIKGGKE
ncbi:MAG: tRNA (adenosine(37)-N6)-threonylcarbamoyltransferase complex ATPase subunit type 1 TsaE [Spirochaetales bacterium]|jgi:tRNA threonylcarbamoyladenosine biosynthesis protein TsaE|nr:tRNA (adenosine(37)-N6)-threonylcarbamoyltransferase complex ATPase subunit type 1 TsaE [Spirochaetales bacterium]